MQLVTGEELEQMKYREYINNPEYFDKTNYSFETTADSSVVAYKQCKERTEELNSDFFLVSDVSYYQQKFHYNCSQKLNIWRLCSICSFFDFVL